jgi:hypothetical protein
MNSLFEEKGLEAHPDKTGFIYFKGNKRDIQKVESELEAMPITFGDFTMGRRQKDKYLGQYLHEDGLAASVAATVADRAGRFKAATFEIRSIIEDFTMQSLGGLGAAKILLERALIPSLLYGAGNWVGMDRRTEEECDKLQYLFWRVMFGVPDGTPKIALIAETGTMRMKWRIWEAKIFMIDRIYKQEQGTLARRVYEEQLRQGWPGLAMEVREICQKVGLPDH